MVNKVTLIGNLGRDPEIRHLESGAMVARFSVATNENYRDKDGNWQTVTEWHDVVGWRSIAERVEKVLRKGSLVYLEGKLTHRKYQDKDGVDRYVTEVVANVLRPLDKRDGMTGGGEYVPGGEAATRGVAYEVPPNQTAPNRAEDPMEDDLPF